MSGFRIKTLYYLGFTCWILIFGNSHVSKGRGVSIWVLTVEVRAVRIGSQLPCRGTAG